MNNSRFAPLALWTGYIFFPDSSPRRMDNKGQASAEPPLNYSMTKSDLVAFNVIDDRSHASLHIYSENLV